MNIDLKDDDAVEVQMAPMIDCVFLLLIFFLVATTLKKVDKELPLELPDAAAAIEVQQPEGFTVVSIDNEGAFHVDGAPVSVNLLQNRIRALGATEDAKVRLDIDRSTSFQRVMEVLDMLAFEEVPYTGIKVREESATGQY
ncbi:MAG: ExbD/TolR family protein [Puniceicoccaceae bacterium]